MDSALRVFAGVVVVDGVERKRKMRMESWEACRDGFPRRPGENSPLHERFKMPVGTKQPASDFNGQAGLSWEDCALP